MLKLNIGSRAITNEELRIACAPLTFEVKTVVSRTTNQLMVKFEEGGYSDPALAAEIVARCFVSISQNGETFPLNAPEAADGLRQAGGDEFICVLVDRFISNHYGFFAKDSPGLETP